MQSAAEQFYQLRKSIGLRNVNAPMDSIPTQYRNTRFAIGVDTEKVLGASFSGYNSKAGDLTVLRLKPTSAGAGAADLDGAAICTSSPQLAPYIF